MARSTISAGGRCPALLRRAALTAYGGVAMRVKGWMTWATIVLVPAYPGASIASDQGFVHLDDGE